MRHHSFHVLGQGIVGLLNIFPNSYLGIVLSNHFKFGLKQKEAVEYLQDSVYVYQNWWNRLILYALEYVRQFSKISSRWV